MSKENRSGSDAAVRSRSDARPGPDVRRGVRRASAFLARRSLKAHRRAWGAVFVATTAAAALIGAFALVVGSLLLAQPPVERYAGADAVVAADQQVTYTAKPWGSEPQTATAYLPERVRLDRSVVARAAAAHGVAKAVADDSVPVTVGGEGGAASGSGRSWAAAALTPYRLTEGHAPRTATEVVLDGVLAAATGSGTGDQVTLQVDGAPRPYTVSGVVGAGHGGGSPAVFLTEEHLTALAGHPGTVDAVGIVAEAGVLTGALRASLEDALPDRARGDRAIRVLTGPERGQAEYPDALGARDELLPLLASITGTVFMVALLVIATTLSQAVHQRSGELALLRAVGATPRQLRSAVGREVSRVAGAAAVLGGVGAVPLGLLMRSLLTTDPLPLPVPVWLPFAAAAAAAVLVALAARPVSVLAARSITGLRPAAALGAAGAPEPGEPGRVRTVCGSVLAVAGVSAAGAATAQGGQAAAVAASGAATSLIIAVALLGPWIARVAMRVLGTPVRRAGGVSGFLAARSAAAHNRRLGAAITPIVLVVAFVCVQLAAASTLERAAGRQAAAALRADLVVTGPAAGLPAGAARAVREAPGVAAATGVLRSGVVLAHREMGDPKLDRFPVLGVTADQLAGTLDPRVTAGDLADLTGRSTVAVGEDRADDLDVGPGDRVKLRLGDGTEVRLRVVALYERALGLGEFMLPREALAGHVPALRDQRILIRSTDGTAAATAASVRRALAPYEGVRVRPATADDVRIAPTSSDQDNAMIIIGVGVIGGFALLAVVSTLSLITVGRRAEFRLLRMVGAGRRQVRRMLVLETGLVAVAGLAIGTLVAAVPLVAFAVSATGSVPYLPPERYGVLALAVTVAAGAGALWPGSSGGRSGLGRRM
ncbi:FtsX-like permease family protein [Streptomyces atratus]|uniref:Putative ABC transport system permease protein n=1 Tax=Streptomyces atratus TaxID=1893 RepID=A0A1K2BF02_STRAR|nr:ABC transporter permease [Streptomyces atratus]SFX96764.1 putative ABC transport system permease protein [Streptomyces atratus]